MERPFFYLKSCYALWLLRRTFLFLLYVCVFYLSLTQWHKKCMIYNNWTATRGMTITVFIWGSAKDRNACKCIIMFAWLSITIRDGALVRNVEGESLHRGWLEIRSIRP